MENMGPTEIAYFWHGNDNPISRVDNNTYWTDIKANNTTKPWSLNLLNNHLIHWSPLSTTSFVELDFEGIQIIVESYELQERVSLTESRINWSWNLPRKFLPRK